MVKTKITKIILFTLCIQYWGCLEDYNKLKLCKHNLIDSKDGRIEVEIEGASYKTYSTETRVTPQILIKVKISTDTQINISENYFLVDNKKDTLFPLLLNNEKKVIRQNNDYEILLNFRPRENVIILPVLLNVGEIISGTEFYDLENICLDIPEKSF